MLKQYELDAKEEEEIRREREFPTVRMMMIAPSESGKTLLLQDWTIDMINKGAYHANRVVIISPTAKTDTSQEKLIKLCNKKYVKSTPKAKSFAMANVFEEIPMEFLEELMQIQKFIKETQPGKLRKWLLQLDDLSTAEALKKKNTVMDRIATTGRHFGISLVQCFQASKNTVSSTIKLQQTIICIGKINNRKEIEELLQMFNMDCGDSVKECTDFIMNCYKDARKSNSGFGFLVINVKVPWGEGQLQRNFENYYYDKQGLQNGKSDINAITDQ